ncbi:hypothetical protein [Patiriisocius sp. Uisw_017]
MLRFYLFTDYKPAPTIQEDVTAVAYNNSPMPFVVINNTTIN